MNLPDNMTLQATLESDRDRVARQSMIVEFVSWSGRVALLLAVVLSPWMLGGIRHWCQSLMAFALLFGLAFWWFETAVSRKKTQYFPYVFFPLALGILIGLLQLMPLPESVVETLGGRQSELYERYSVDARQLMAENPDLSGVTRRLSIAPEQGWQQIWLLLIGVAGLLLGCRLFRTPRDILVLFAVLTINGVAISVFGWVQQFTSKPGTIFWTIELTQGGTPFGPYVNRNNAAGYLLMCLASAIGLLLMVIGQRKTSGPKLMVSKEMPFWRRFQTSVLYFIADLTATKLAVLIGIVVIMTGIMSSLSRGGVLAMLVGGIAAFLTYGMARRPKNASLILFPLGVLVLAMSSWIGFGGELIDRFGEIESNNVVQEDARIQTWTDTYPATRDLGLFGSGLGSYGTIHRLYRNDAEESVFQFAENQYFQALIDAGWPGCILFVSAILITWLCTMLLLYKGSSASSISIGVAGVFLVASGAVAAFFDFGLYMPANTLLMSVLIGFVSYHGHALAGRLKKKTWLRMPLPNVVIQVVLLVTFAGVTLAALDNRRSAKLEKATLINLAAVDYMTMDLGQTDAAIELVGSQIRNVPSSRGFNYLGRLFVHRARLAYFDELVSRMPMGNVSAEAKEKFMEGAWQYTKLDRMHEQYNYLKRDVSEYQAKRFLDEEFITKNLPFAQKYFMLSRRKSPMQPRVHYNLGLINCLLDSKRVGDRDLERAIELAPSNLALKRAVGTAYLQSSDTENCSRHFRRYLELQEQRKVKREYNRIMNLVTARTNRKVKPMDEKEIYMSVIPDNPWMLFTYATRYLDKNSPHRLDVLEKADLLLGEASLSKRDDVLLSGHIRLEKGDTAAGIEQLEIAMISEPGDQETRVELCRLYLQEGRLDDAKEDADYLYRMNSRNDTYKKLRNDVKEAIRLRDEKEKEERTK